MKDIRQKLNLSQGMLASFMRISRSLLSLVEKAERSLPPAALKRANLLLKVIYDSNKPAPPQEAEQRALQTIALNKQLQKRWDRCQVKLANAHVKLKALQANYDTCMAKLQLVNELLPTLSDGLQGRRDRNWLKVQETQAEHQLKTCGFKAQQTLLLQMEILELEMGAVERRMVGQGV